MNTSKIRKLNSSITTKSLSCSLYSHTLPQTLAAAAELHQSCPTLCDPIDRRQPTRLPHPWSSPGKNTGVGCYFLLQCMKVKSESEVTQSCTTLHNPIDCSLPGFSIHGIFQAGVLEWVAMSFSIRPWSPLIIVSASVFFKNFIEIES